MSDLAILKEMIKDTAIVPLLEYKSHCYKAILEEKEEGEFINKKANYTVDILGLPNKDDAMVIKVDAFKSPDTIFNEHNGIRRRSDFVIIADVTPKKVIVFVELKAGDGGTKKGIIQQFKGAQCFIRYCQDIGCSFWERDNFLKDYEYRFVAILEICNSIRKRSTAEPERKIAHDSPENMNRIKHRQEIRFRELIR